MAATLRKLHQAYLRLGARRHLTHEHEELCAAVIELRGKGWKLQTIGDAIGVTRERIRQIEAKGSTVPAPFDAPWPPQPEPPPAPEPKPEPLRLTAEQARELRGLQRQACLVRGPTPADHPSRKAAARLARLFDHYIKAGYSAKHIASATGITDAAVSFRLGRYGYKPLPPSQTFRTTFQPDDKEES